MDESASQATGQSGGVGALTSEVALSRHPVFGHARRITSPAVIAAVNDLMMRGNDSASPVAFARTLQEIVATLPRHPDGNRIGDWHLREHFFVWTGSAIDIRFNEQPAHLRVRYDTGGQPTAIQEIKPRKILGLSWGTYFADCHRPNFTAPSSLNTRTSTL